MFVLALLLALWLCWSVTVCYALLFCGCRYTLTCLVITFLGVLVLEVGLQHCKAELTPTNGRTAAAAGKNM
jgi:hypothetical protein